MDETWDVAVVGAGPAGLSAAYEAAGRGARTIVLEKAAHPRYKTCGGGLIGTSLGQVHGRIDVPAADWIKQVSFTHDGAREFSRRSRDGRLLAMVRRSDFDDALKRAAVSAGAVVREQAAVRSVSGDGVVTLADGSAVRAASVIGADGSAGVTARFVGATYDQVDLGLEVELPVSPPVAAEWRGRVLIDWGPIPGSYAWVFPKDDVLTVGVIAARGEGAETKAYLRSFVARLGLSGVEPVHDSGHLTRCRAAGSPLTRDRVLLAGDAAGLLEPWSREGISYALRSGALAGRYAASADPDGYSRAVAATFDPPMLAGRRLLAAYRRHPGLFHSALSTPAGWQLFTRFCVDTAGFYRTLRRAPVRAALAALTV